MKRNCNLPTVALHQLPCNVPMKCLLCYGHSNICHFQYVKNCLTGDDAYIRVVMYVAVGVR